MTFHSSSRVTLVLFASLLAVPASAQGPPTLAWSVFAAGGASAGSDVTLLDSLGESVVGPSGEVAAGFFPGALLDADETWCSLPAGLPAGEHAFHRSTRPRIAVAVTGSLGCVRVQRVDGAAPGWVAGIETGRHWLLTGTDAAGAPAGGFELSLTLPYAGAPVDPHVCRYTGAHWDCARTSVAAGFVTRGGITALSPWAVGEGPVPVTLIRFRVD